MEVGISEKLCTKTGHTNWYKDATLISSWHLIPEDHFQEGTSKHRFTLPAGMWIVENKQSSSVSFVNLHTWKKTQET